MAKHTFKAGDKVVVPPWEVAAKIVKPDSCGMICDLGPGTWADIAGVIQIVRAERFRCAEYGKPTYRLESGWFFPGKLLFSANVFLPRKAAKKKHPKIHPSLKRKRGA